MEVILLFSIVWAVLIIASIIHVLTLALRILKGKGRKDDINIRTGSLLTH